LDKIKGALYGLAIGDALGGTTEFLTKAEIRVKYGRVEEIRGGGVWLLEKGETTDDTAMTLAVAKGIIDYPADPIHAIGQYFLEWYRSKPKDIGSIIETVFKLYDGDWLESAKLAHEKYLGGQSAGNGSLMRCLPIALAYSSREKVVEMTKLQSAMTHYDEAAGEACLIYNKIAYRVLQGAELKESIAEEVKGTNYEFILNRRKPDCPPDGYVVRTLQWVLFWLLTSNSFSEVVIGAANEGGDSDTIAAIAGGLAGLSCGFKQLPEKFTEALLIKESLDKISSQIEKLRTNNR
jgi:ADP-ribosyl-[dinitrogen reductase] hydrolase